MAGVKSSSTSFICWCIMPMAIDAAPFCANKAGFKKACSKAMLMTLPVMLPLGSM